VEHGSGPRNESLEKISFRSMGCAVTHSDCNAAPDVLYVNCLFQAYVVPAGSLVQAELQGVCGSLRLMRRQNQKTPMVAILIYALKGHNQPSNLCRKV
jgi:hypothetical protein